jgi:hypothetical protein
LSNCALTAFIISATAHVGRTWKQGIAARVSIFSQRIGAALLLSLARLEMC